VAGAGDDGLSASGALRACTGRRPPSAAGRDHRPDRRPHGLRHARADERCAAKGNPMNATRQIHDAGQALWLEHITRPLLSGGTLSRYIGELSVTGLTSNPTIFDHAIKNSE